MCAFTRGECDATTASGTQALGRRGWASVLMSPLTLRILHATRTTKVTYLRSKSPRCVRRDALIRLPDYYDCW